MTEGFNVRIAVLSIGALSAMAACTQAQAGQNSQPPQRPAIEARMESPRPDAPDQIRTMIESQLKAFRKSDPAGTYRFASDAARKKYGSAKSFFVMMRSACHALPGHLSYFFMERTEFDGKALQKIEFLNSDGSASTGFYRLVKNADGAWAVDGCLMLQADAQPI